MSTVRRLNDNALFLLFDVLIGLCIIMKDPRAWGNLAGVFRLKKLNCLCTSYSNINGHYSMQFALLSLKLPMRNGAHMQNLSLRPWEIKDRGYIFPFPLNFILI